MEEEVVLVDILSFIVLFEILLLFLFYILKLVVVVEFILVSLF